ncbi:unnamed protein product [Trichobilharzia szidati]|nr:unnamed protein product [Trichobilharzia szidati]
MSRENQLDITEMFKQGEIEQLTDLLLNFPSILNQQNENGDYLAHIAAQYGRSELIMLMARLSYNFNKYFNCLGYLPVHTACHYQQFDCLIALKLSGADLNAITESDFLTPLHIACITGSLPIVRYLLRENVQWNVVDLYGRTPGKLALIHNNLSAADEIFNYSRS